MTVLDGLICGDDQETTKWKLILANATSSLNTRRLVELFLGDVLFEMLVTFGESEIEDWGLKISPSKHRAFKPKLTLVAQCFKLAVEKKGWHSLEAQREGTRTTACLYEWVGVEYV